jgi:hypothetical protein
MTMTHMRNIAFAITLPLGALISAPASASDWDWIIGCCLSPNPIECFKEGSAQVKFKDEEQLASLTERMAKLAQSGAFDEARKTKDELGLKKGPYTSSCSPHKTLTLFEKRVPLEKVQAECDVQSIRK